MRERREREFEPTVRELRSCLADPDFVRQPEATQVRLKETLALMESLSAWSEEMLELETSTLKKLLRLGARIRNLLRSPPKQRAA